METRKGYRSTLLLVPVSRVDGTIVNCLLENTHGSSLSSVHVTAGHWMCTLVYYALVVHVSVRYWLILPRRPSQTSQVSSFFMLHTLCACLVHLWCCRDQWWQSYMYVVPSLCNSPRLLKPSMIWQLAPWLVASILCVTLCLRCDPLGARSIGSNLG